VRRLLAIGAVAGIVVPLGVDLLEHWRIDDPIGAWPVHGLAGIWGTLSVGLLATGAYGVPTPTGSDTTTVVRGLLYGGGLSQLKAQLIGSLTAVVVVSAASIAVMYGVKAVRLLRLSRDGELEGLDLHEHGTPAYHVEFGQGMTYTTLVGAGGPPMGGGRSELASSPPAEVES